MWHERKYLKSLEQALTQFPAVGLVGPRQVGKTTLVRQFMEKQQGNSLYLDLELPSDLARLRDPESYLSENSNKLIILDEVQHRLDLFPLLRALIDQDDRPGRFILLGSASPELIRDSSESLAGRIKYLQIHPFDLLESRSFTETRSLWFRGGYPRSLLSPDESRASDWIQAFVRTYLERDLPLLGLSASPALSGRLWTMMAHLNGQQLNYSLLAKSLAISSVWIKRHIDFFEEAFLIFRLPPHISNSRKRLVKSPKLYFTDTGILHYLLYIHDSDQLQAFPAVGNSWEAFCIQQIRACLPGSLNLGYYRSQDGAECDLVISSAGKPLAAMEIKLSNVPKVSKGNMIAMQDLDAPHNFILTPSSDDYPFNRSIRVCSLERFLEHYLPKF